jgi:hypothetical protein
MNDKARRLGIWNKAEEQKRTALSLLTLQATWHP